MRSSLTAAILVGAGIAAYATSFHGVFVLDDIASIPGNATIHPWSWRAILSPFHMGGATVEGRPLLNLSLAINYAVSGLRPWSYHAFNLAVHLAAGLTLWGILRRFADDGLACALALVWTVHPLNTEAVTYVVQRAESLMGLFYLLTIYGFVSGTSRGRLLSVFACLLGAATKEVIVSAPVVVLLIDRWRYAGSFGQAWRVRKGYYLGLAASWVLLGVLVYHAGNRGTTSGIGAGVSVGRYWETQPLAILRYIGLSIVPYPLLFDYGTEWITNFAWFAVPGVFIAALIGLTVRGLARNDAWGVIGFAFFAILAPTSLIPGNRQTAAEHRMYLALIPCLCGIAWLIVVARRRNQARAAAILFVLAIPAAAATAVRNLTYSSALRLFGDLVAKDPDNPFAQTNFGTALLLDGRYAGAEAHLRKALRLKPDFADAENNLGSALFYQHHFTEAEQHYRRAAALNPLFADPDDNLAETYLQEDRIEDARREAEAALRLNPNLAGAHNNLGVVWQREGHPDEALAELRRSLALNPDNADAHLNLGNVLRDTGQASAAEAEYARARELAPNNGLIDYDWGSLLLAQKRPQEAEAWLRRAIALLPEHAEARDNLGNALLAEGRAGDAVAAYTEAARLAPNNAVIHYNYGNGLSRQGRRAEAIAEFKRALELDPQLRAAQEMLGRLQGGPL